ncbi:MAG: hypothetical protein J0L64_08005, partial [Acidobacteria bacterium]|nr:hypothetical protein [Acidobacteriota bacterium]
LTTVPSGKRVVIEYAAVACQTLGSDSISDFRIQIPRVINGVNSTIPAPLLVSRQGDSVSVFSVQKWAGGGPVKLYADFSNSYRIYFGFARTSALNEASCNVYVFGHTVNTQ